MLGSVNTNKRLKDVLRMLSSDHST
uniref:Uncharacterized protein n=1 Tax=Arundo donax TaxID=35708 RepID=A0A0A8ZL37_ARUDO